MTLAECKRRLKRSGTSSRATNHMRTNNTMRIWTGPTQVKEMAEKFRQAGFTVTCEGTEYIYYEIPLYAWDQLGPDTVKLEAFVKRTLKDTHGTDFGLFARF